MEFLHEKDRIVVRASDASILAEVDHPDDGSGVVHVTHTFVDDSLRGQGVAGRLMEELVNRLRANGQKAMLVCSYAKSWFAKHPEAQDCLYAPKRKPVIGVTPNVSENEDQLSISRTTLEALHAAGAVAVLLDATDDDTALNDILDTLDGVLFSGGGDIDPMQFGEYQHPNCGIISPMRDAMELKLARMVALRGKAMLGICRGAQVIAVALGGKIWQDIPSQYPHEVIQHRQKNPSRCASHPVSIVPGSLLHSILGADSVLVNSFHHQAVKESGPALRITAAAPDGIAEAIEHKDLPFCLGVQWHPERMWEHNDAARKLFTTFVEACKASADQR